MRKTKKIAPLVVADDHDFVGRIFDLAMPLELGFKSNKQLSRYNDCHYVMQVYWRLGFLIDRTESLNIVRKMLLKRNLPKSFKGFPVNRYEWLTICADIFLMRYVSVSDCCLHLTNEVFETGLSPRACNLDNLRQKGVNPKVLSALTHIAGYASSHRTERNSRVHESLERSFTPHDGAFRAMSVMEMWNDKPYTITSKGRASDVTKWFDAAIKRLRKETTDASTKLAGALPDLYSALHQEFEVRFGEKFAARKKPLPWYPTAPSPRSKSKHP
jgi:hypothetical protein